ncbi:swarming motility protein ybiA, partial [Piptocephalis cylindrospora]
PPKVIRFYHRHESYYAFSNLSPFPFEDNNGMRWDTVEHYFQAHKFVDKQARLFIAKQPTARLAFQEARHWDSLKRDDWYRIKETIMLDALSFKWEQHENLRTKLLSTGTVRLEEHTSMDTYWGDGGETGNGKNRLGKMLIHLRYHLQKGTPLHSLRSDYSYQ